MTEQERFEQWAKPDPVQSRTTEEGDYFDRGMVAAWNGWMAAKRDAADDVERLRSEVEALRNDAARYRWIRENGAGDQWEIVFDECGRGLLQAEALDAAIDAAMKSEQSRLICEAKE